MGLTPTVEQPMILDESELLTYPTKTYNMELENGRIRGFSDDLESMKQVIFLALNTALQDVVGGSAMDVQNLPKGGEQAIEHAFLFRK